MASWNPLRWFGREEKASAAGAVISAWHVGQPVWSNRDFASFADEAFIRNAVAHRCIKLIAGKGASARWLLHDRRGKEIEQHPLLDLLSRPNPVNAGNALFEAIYAYLLLAGNSYLESVGPTRGAPRELWTLRPDRMRVIPGSVGIPRGYEYEANGRKVTWQADPMTGKGPIIHVREFHPLDDWYGLSRVEPAAYAVDRYNAASAHNKALLDNGARPSGALIFEPVKTGDNVFQTAPDSVLEAAKKRLTESYGGPENAGRPMVFGGNVKWEAMGLAPKDMDYGASKDDAGRDICSAFNVPHILIVRGSATYNNIREAKLELWEDAILPVIDKVKDALNSLLAPQFGDGLKLSIDLDSIPDLEPRREIRRATVTSLVQAGVIDSDEGREALQYGPRPPAAVEKVDAGVLGALIASVNVAGYEPLYRYLASVSLLPAGMTLDQFIEAGAADFGSAEDAIAALLPTDETKAAKKTLYVSRHLLNGDELIAWAKEQGFRKTIPAGQLHVTVAYSRRALDWSKVKPDMGELRVPPSKNRTIEPLGDQGAVVLLFQSAELQERWKAIREAGASWDYPGYRPHVSITYADGDIDLDAIEPFTGELRFGPERFEEIDEGALESVRQSEKRFNPNRVPAGSPEGGQFAGGDGRPGGARALSQAAANRDEWPAHIQALRVPPAWTDVRYSEDPNADLLVVGRDAKGRAQYVYSERHSAAQAEAKFARVSSLLENYDAMKAQNRANELSRDANVAAHAEATSVIMATGIRPGSTADTRADAQAYGATTLEGRHVVSDGSGVSLQFVGKKGVALNIAVDDAHAASILTRRAAESGPDGRLFPGVTQSSLSGYVGSLGPGGFHTKDLRTARGTSLAHETVRSMSAPTTPASYKRAVRDVAVKVSGALGNTPTVALQSYINPTVFGGWRDAAGV